MLDTKLAVLGQVAYAYSVRDFIREMLKRLIPGGWINVVFAGGDEEFYFRLKAAFEQLNATVTTASEYREAIAAVLCEEVSRLCRELKVVCRNRGCCRYYEENISRERFVELVRNTDIKKLEKMQKILERTELTPIDIIREIGAVLNDRQGEGCATLSAAERNSANETLSEIAQDVRTSMMLGFAQTKQRLLECKSGIDELRSGVAAMGRGLSGVGKRGRRRGKYDAVSEMCLAVWERDCTDLNLRNSLNTRVTYEAVFERRKRELAAMKIDSVEKFRRVIHAAQSKRSHEGANAQTIKR